MSIVRHVISYVGRFSAVNYIYVSSWWGASLFSFFWLIFWLCLRTNCFVSHRRWVFLTLHLCNADDGCLCRSVSTLSQPGSSTSLDVAHIRGSSSAHTTLSFATWHIPWLQGIQDARYHFLWLPIGNQQHTFREL